MGKNTWDAILASTPLDIVAGRVTAGKADAYEPQSKVVAQEWDAPPRFVAFIPDTNRSNLVGRHFGRLTVIGYLGGGKWCCRCACGKYVSRRNKAVLNQANAEVDRCTHCRHTAFLQRAASYEQTKHRRLNGIIGAPVYRDGRKP